VGWALDGGEDIGGLQEDLDYVFQLESQAAAIKEDRKRRVRDLNGRYVVATRGKSSGNLHLIKKGYELMELKEYFTNQEKVIEELAASIRQQKSIAIGSTFDYLNEEVVVVEINWHDKDVLIEYEDGREEWINFYIKGV
jgi:hypothetical protein